jgi:hypothetical protein
MVEVRTLLLEQEIEILLALHLVSVGLRMFESRPIVPQIWPAGVEMPARLFVRAEQKKQEWDPCFGSLPLPLPLPSLCSL